MSSVNLPPNGGPSLPKWEPGGGINQPFTQALFGLKEAERFARKKDRRLQLGYGPPHRKDYPTGEEGDRAYVEDYTQYLIFRSNPRIQQRLQRIQNAVNLFNKTTASAKPANRLSNKDTDFIPPTDYVFVNQFYTAINQVIGEFASQKMDIKVVLTNSSAKTAKEQFKSGLYLSSFLKQQGVPDIAEEANLPDSDFLQGRSIEDYMNDPSKGYRDKTAFIMERLMEDWCNSPNCGNGATFWQWLREAFKYYWITDTIHSVPFVDPYSLEVKLPTVRPNYVVYDVDQDTDLILDPDYTITFRYVPIEEAKSMFPDVKIEEMEAQLGSQGGVYGLPLYQVNRNEPQIGVPSSILVVDLYWRVSVDKMIELPTDEVQINFNLEEDGEEIDVEVKTQRKKERVEEVWQASVLGSTALHFPLARFGRVDPYYEIRSVDSPLRASLPIASLVRGWSTKQAFDSPLDADYVVELIELRNNLFSKANELIQNTMGNILQVDPSVVPEFSESGNPADNIETWLSYIKSQRILLTSEPGIQDMQRGSSVSVINLDNNIATIQGIYTTIQSIDAQIQQMTGIDPTRQGQIGQYTKASVAQQSQAASMARTQQKFQLFVDWANRTLQNVAQILQKTTYAKVLMLSEDSGPIDKLRLTVGDEVMSIDDSFAASDIGIKVELGDDIMERKNTLLQWIPIALQHATSAEMALDLLQLLNNPNPDDAINQARRNAQEREKEAQARAMQQQQMQQQNIAMQAQLQGQNQIAAEQAKAQAQSALQAQKTEGDLMSKLVEMGAQNAMQEGEGA